MPVIAGLSAMQFTFIVSTVIENGAGTKGSNTWTFLQNPEVGHNLE